MPWITPLLAECQYRNRISIHNQPLIERKNICDWLFILLNIFPHPRFFLDENEVGGVCRSFLDPLHLHSSCRHWHLQPEAQRSAPGAGLYISQPELPRGRRTSWDPWEDPWVHQPSSVGAVQSQWALWNFSLQASLQRQVWRCKHLHVPAQHLNSLCHDETGGLQQYAGADYGSKAVRSYVTFS